MSVSVFAPEADRASCKRALSICRVFFIQPILPYMYGRTSLIPAVLTSAVGLSKRLRLPRWAQAGERLTHYLGHFLFVSNDRCRSTRTDRFPLRAKRTYVWEGKSYARTHPPLVSPEIFSPVREVPSGKARPRKQKHDFAFSGLLHCAYDNCAVTAEFKKQKYTYYRCTGYRGKCDLPYFREEAMAERLGQVLQDDL